MPIDTWTQTQNFISINLKNATDLVEVTDSVDQADSVDEVNTSGSENLSDAAVAD